ncbi:hypothetical protein [uncultured Microbacterium sp.]|uniref:hypothetical protein n=1 Tax=uncultured Microbacterium sp. TaxID=191216 RepID=UPI0025F1F361|nr:hypothetical protein [uncultured Microbacterium sp.]
MAVSDDRVAVIDELREGARCLVETVEDLRRVLPSVATAEGVHLDFGSDGVLRSVDISPETRRECTVEDLLGRITVAFAVAPVPENILEALVRNPDDLFDRWRSIERRLHISESRAVTLVACLGRPIEVRGRETDLLFTSTTELSETIVGLAQRAAQEAGWAA